MLSPCALDHWPTRLKIYTANVQVTIYIPAKFERDSTKNDREIGWRRWWERRKIKSKKEKTLQQQEGLPTMSVDLNYVDRGLFCCWPKFRVYQISEKQAWSQLCILCGDIMKSNRGLRYFISRSLRSRSSLSIPSSYTKRETVMVKVQK